MSFYEDLITANELVANASGLSIHLWRDYTKRDTDKSSLEPASSYFFKPLESAYDGAHRVLTIITDPLVFLLDLVQTFLYGLYCLFKKAVELHNGFEDLQKPLPSFSEYTTYFIGTALGVVASPFANLIDLIGVAVNACKASIGEGDPVDAVKPGANPAPIAYV